jgi:uncharacterized protein YggE
MSDDGITVTGSGTATAPPDVVRLMLAAESTESSMQSALDTATAGLTAMRTALTDAGIAEADLRSTEASLWSGQGQPDGALRHTARFGLEATVRSVIDAGRVVTAALKAAGESGRMNGMSFAHSDPSSLQAQARAKAVDAAKAKAEQLAALTGRTLGEVREVAEGQAGVGPPVPIGRMMAAAAEAVPVSGGQLEVNAAVTIRWAWASDD